MDRTKTACVQGARVARDLKRVESKRPSRTYQEVKKNSDGEIGRRTTRQSTRHFSSGNGDVEAGRWSSSRVCVAGKLFPNDLVAAARPSSLL